MRTGTSASRLVVPDHRPPGSFTDSLNEEIREIGRIYGCNESDSEIYDYLKSNVELIAVLKEAPAAIERVFGRSLLSLKLDVYDEGSRMLFIVVPCDLSSKELLERENRLDREWYNELPIEVAMKLSFIGAFSYA